MATTHAIPDTFAEMQAVWGDLGPEVIIAHTGLTVPASSLTLPAVSAQGYVWASGPPARLVYVSQPAVSLTLSGGNGTYWLALHSDLSTAVAGWTRRAGSHFVWQMNATQPPGMSNLLGFAQITVAGGVITAVTLVPTAVSQPMSKQRSNAVAITGGNVLGLTSLSVTGTALRMNAVLNGVQVPNYTPPGNDPVAFYGDIAAGTGRYNCFMNGAAPNFFSGAVGIGAPAAAGFGLDVTGASHMRDGLMLGTPTTSPGNSFVMILTPKATTYGLVIQNTLADTGAGLAASFRNSGTTQVGYIDIGASGTTFGTASDVRLKEAVDALPDALATVCALRPVTFRWKVDGTVGHGFLAHEVQQVVPAAVLGEPDAVEDDGTIRPQGMDASKLVVWLCGAVQELAARVEALEAQLA